ncbi:uncharacterized protein METZ01_LOCUS67692, partial [marine metagenome]
VANLTSLKVLDFSTLLPGPYATMMLADMGADVIWVEPIKTRTTLTEATAMRSYLGRSKRSLAINLKADKAHQIIENLIQEYDVIVEQFRPGVMERLGLDYAALSDIQPNIIYCSITGYGQTGPLKNRAGHDINYLSIAGVSSFSGTKEKGPVLSGLQIADIAGGSMHAVTGILAALVYRQQTGKGQWIDVSMTDASFAMNSIHAADYLVNQNNPSYETNALNGGSFYNYYQTKDGKYFSVGSLEPKFFQQLSEALGNPEMFDAKYFHPENQEQIILFIQKAFLQKTYAEWVDIFSNLDACVEPVIGLDEAVNHEQIQARKMVVDVPSLEGEEEKQIGSPIKFSQSTPQHSHTGPPVGMNTEEILLEAGFNSESVQSFINDGVLFQETDKKP